MSRSWLIYWFLLCWWMCTKMKVLTKTPGQTEKVIDYLDSVTHDAVYCLLWFSFFFLSGEERRSAEAFMFSVKWRSERDRGRYAGCEKTVWVSCHFSGLWSFSPIRQIYPDPAQKGVFLVLSLHAQKHWILCNSQWCSLQVIKDSHTDITQPFHFNCGEKKFKISYRLSYWDWKGTVTSQVKLGDLLRLCIFISTQIYVTT